MTRLLLGNKRDRLAYCQDSHILVTDNILVFLFDILNSTKVQKGTLNVLMTKMFFSCIFMLFQNVQMVAICHFAFDVLKFC